MKCKYCGEEIVNDSVFCEHCGKKVCKRSNVNIIWCLLPTLFFASLFFVSCRNGENGNLFSDMSESEDGEYENPIDSIIQNTTEDIRWDEVYRYLTNHPDFVNQSDSTGYRYLCDDCERQMVWKDCGDIRVYSIPCPTMYATCCCNIIQFRDNGRLDTGFFENNDGGMENLYAIRNRLGKTYYILKTRIDVEHQGMIVWECISSFSVERGHLVKENLFHAKNRKYDCVEVECGGQRYLPLNYQNVVLISMSQFEDGVDNPAFVIAEINSNDWPTGYGLKYEWDGTWFEYVGKCPYDVDGFPR